jgi:hypothetical protein
LNKKNQEIQNKGYGIFTLSKNINKIKVHFIIEMIMDNMLESQDNKLIIETRVLALFLINE